MPNRKHGIFCSVEGFGLGFRCFRAALVARRGQHSASRKAGLGVIEHQIGVRGEGDGLTGECDGRVVLLLGRQNLSSRCAPCDGRLQVVAGDAFAFGGIPVSLIDAALREHRSSQQRGGLPCVGADAEGVQPVQRSPEVRLRGDGVTHHQLDDSGEQLGLHQTVPKAEIGDDLAGVRQHRSGLVRAAPQQLQHGQAAQRRRHQ